MITAKQLCTAVNRHNTIMIRAVHDLNGGVDLEIVTRYVLDSTISFMALIVGFREQEEAREPNLGCDRCPCEKYDGQRLTHNWSHCSCGHYAQDHNIKERT